MQDAANALMAELATIDQHGFSAEELDDVKFREIRAKSPLHEELLYRECKHLVKFYMTLCAQDKNYNSILCGLITIKKESSEARHL